MKRILTCLMIPFGLLADHAQHSGADKPAMLMPGFGKVNHGITTSKPQAQKFFDQGLSLIYGFNHEEAIRAFRRAAQIDPLCAMAYWGVGFALGSNYNDPEPEAERLAKAYEATQKALDLSAKGTEAERDYILALSKRYSKDPNADRKALAVAYKDAMAALAKKYPDDYDASTLYAESYMNLRPWNLYNLNGEPEEGTETIVETLEYVLKNDPSHLGANHYYIHAVEASKRPDRALSSAKRLEKLAPKSGHLVHMPAHIYHRTGNYESSARANAAGAAADREYIKRTGASGMYPAMYFAHNLHFLAVDHAMQGNYTEARRAADEMIGNLGDTAVKMPMVEFFMPTRELITIKLRQWDEALKIPEPHKDLKTTHAIWHWARGSAYAAKGNADAAKQEYAELKKALDATAPDAPYGLNKAASVLKVAERTLAARLNPESAEKILEEAIGIEDQFSYEEPPIWYVYSRETLGGLLLRKGNAAAAEAVFRADLERHPNNPRSLFGLVKALEAQGKADAAREARRRADMRLQVADL